MVLGYSGSTIEVTEHLEIKDIGVSKTTKLEALVEHLSIQYPASLYPGGYFSSGVQEDICAQKMLSSSFNVWMNLLKETIMRYSGCVSAIPSLYLLLLAQLLFLARVILLLTVQPLP